MKTSKENGKVLHERKHASNQNTTPTQQDEREQLIFQAGAVYNVIRDWTVSDDWKELLRKRKVTT